MKKIQHIILLFYSFLDYSSYGQNPSQEMRFRYLGLQDGLSQSSIYCIYQDRDGFMWFGTEDGLNKFNGYNFSVYKHDPNDSSSISSGSVFSICEDKDGVLWIGTDYGGMNALDKITGKFTRFKNIPGSNESFSGNRIFSAITDRKGGLWICSYGVGLNWFDKEKNIFKRFRHSDADSNSISNNNVRSLYEDQAGIIWVGAYAGGINALNPATGKCKVYKFQTGSDLPSFQNASILCLASDEKETIWAGTFGGELLSLDKNTGKITVLLKDSSTTEASNKKSITSIQYFKEGTLWVGTLGGGIIVYDTHTGKSYSMRNNPLEVHSLRSNSVSRIYEDRSGVVWIGMMGSGLNLFDTKGGKFHVYKHNPYNSNSISNNNINAICEGKNGNIWIGTAGGGLCLLNRKENIIQRFQHQASDRATLNDDNIGCLWEDADGSLWVGTTGGGLNLKKANTNHFIKYQNDPADSNSIGLGSLKVLYEDRDQQLWIGMRGSALNALDKKTMRFRHFYYNPADSTSIRTYNLRSIFEDEQGFIWIGTRGGGLYKMDKKTNKFYVFKNDSSNTRSLNNNNIMCITKDRDILWLGTFGGGINAMVTEEKGFPVFYHFTEKEGLNNNVVYSILPDHQGNFWLSTNNGICKFTPPADLNNPQSAKYHSYDVNDGLLSNEFTSGAYCRARDGWMYFGSSEGMVAFHPDSIRSNEHIPPVYITSFKVFEKNYPLDTAIFLKKSISLTYDQSFFSFEFTSLDYSLPQKNKYAYKMEGFDKDWIYSGSRRYASYTNLDPGYYYFCVKASNNDEVWNEAGVRLQLIILPPWWQTWWFRFFALASVLLSIIVYVRKRESSLRRHKAILEQKVHARTLQLKEEKENVEIQKSLVEEKNQNITDSINYAKRIQNSILPSRETIKQLLPDAFIWYQPKDIISGDFYWIAEKEDLIFLAVADCTGHGVPGALMSMLGSSLLHQIVNNKTINEPSRILGELDREVIRSLQQKGMDGESKEGMDISFVELNRSNRQLRFAGAKRPLLIYRRGELMEMAGSKHPIGSITRKEKSFDNHLFQMCDGDSFYIFSDGIADQFGGSGNKKFMSRRLKEVLAAIQHLPMEQQFMELIGQFTAWKGKHDQVDDICMIGVRI